MGTAISSITKGHRIRSDEIWSSGELSGMNLNQSEPLLSNIDEPLIKFHRIVLLFDNCGLAEFDKKSIEESRKYLIEQGFTDFVRDYDIGKM